MSDRKIDAWLLKQLVCPVHQLPLEEDGDDLRCAGGDRYPVVEGVPVMVRSDVQQTLWVAEESLQMVDDYRSGKQSFSALGADATAVDEAVQGLVAATNGYLYLPLVNKLKRYPIPELRLPRAQPGQTLLDVGCGWGRWTIAAAQKGYVAVGLDPSLRHVLAARRVCNQLGVSAHFVVADARYAPFSRSLFDVGFSYSVLQHFSKEDARKAIESIAQVVRPGGIVHVQMPNTFGVRCLYHQARRGFREPDSFHVRYWTPRELLTTFAAIVGDASLSVDGFFGLGIQPSDLDMLPRHYRAVVRCSEALRQLTHSTAPWLINVADSLYVTAKCPELPPQRQKDASASAFVS